MHPRLLNGNAPYVRIARIMDEELTQIRCIAAHEYWKPRDGRAALLAVVEPSVLTEYYSFAIVVGCAWRADGGDQSARAL